MVVKACSVFVLPGVTIIKEIVDSRFDGIPVTSITSRTVIMYVLFCRCHTMATPVKRKTKSLDRI